MSDNPEVDIYLDYLNEIESRQENHSTLVDGIIDNLREDFSKEFRDSLIKCSINDEEFDIRLNDLLFSLLLIPSKFYIDNYTITKADFLFNVKNINGTIKSYFDNTIENSNDTHISKICEGFYEVVSELAKKSWEVNLIKGNTINVYDIIHLIKDYPRIKELCYFESNENSQFSEIEASVEEAAKELIHILKNDVDSCYKNLLNTVSAKQFQQVFVNVSLKPDLFGMIIEKPINTSFIRGMRNSTDYFINANGARKALITNATQVRSAGYLARKLALLVINTKLNRQIEDCGSEDYLPIHIDSEELAKRFANRYYKLDTSERKLKYTTTVKSTKNLVGKTIYLRSPATCKLEGSHFCKKCYGRLSNINQFHPALSSMLMLTEQITQMLLSSKHLLQVIADKVELSEDFAEYFEVDKNSLISTKECKIKVDEIYVDDLTGDTTITKLSIYDEDKVVEVELDSLELFPSSIADKISSDDLIDIKAGEEIFRVSVENNEISAPLKKLLKIIESEDELNSKGSASTLLKDLLELLIKSSIKLSSVGIEFIIREIARNPDNIQERAESLDTAKFLRLTNAILHSSSPAVSLAFERHKYLLENNLFSKHEESIIDNIF